MVLPRSSVGIRQRRSSVPSVNAGLLVEGIGAPPIRWEIHLARPENTTYNKTKIMIYFKRVSP